MFLLVPLILALVTVPLAGGSLRRLDDLSLRHGWALATGLGLQIFVISAFPDAIDFLREPLHIGSYLFLGWFVYQNARVPGILLIGAGGLTNFIAIVSNGGVMPASETALRSAGVIHGDGDFANSTLVADPNVSFLGDIFSVPADVPVLNNVFSIGDVLIGIGAFVLIHGVCGAKWLRRASSPTEIASIAAIDVTADGHGLVLEGASGERYRLTIDEKLVEQLEVAVQRSKSPQPPTEPVAEGVRSVAKPKPRPAPS